MISIVNFILGFYILIVILLTWRNTIHTHTKPSTELILISFAVATIVVFNINEAIGSYRSLGLFKYPSALYAITGGWPSYMITKLVSLIAMIPVVRRLHSSSIVNNSRGDNKQR